MTTPPNVTVLDHPLIQHKLTLLREKQTAVGDFRRIAREISLLACYEVLATCRSRNARSRRRWSR